MVSYSKPSSDQYNEFCLNLVELSQYAFSRLRFLKLTHQCFYVHLLRYRAERGNCDVSIAFVYLLMLSTVFSFMLTILLLTAPIILYFSCRSRSYSSNLLVIKSIAPLNEFNWLLPLIWLLLFFHTSGELFSSLLSTFSCNYKELLHSLLTSKDSVKASVFVAFAVESSKLDSLGLFESSPSLDLLLKSPFFSSKNFVISIILQIF